MKDLGSFHFCLGICGNRYEHGLRLSQTIYVEKLLERYGLQDCNPVSTPADINVKLSIDKESKAVDPVRHQSVVTSLLYAAMATRPDICQAVGAFSKFLVAPTETHMTAVNV